MIERDSSLVLRLTFQGFSAQSVGLAGVFYLPRMADPVLPAHALRLAWHHDARLTLQQSTLCGESRRWLDVIRLLPLELTVGCE